MTTDYLKNMNLTELKNAFRETPYKKLILFGSQVTGNATEYSDVDILLIVEKEMSFGEKGKLASQLRWKLAEKEIDADIVIHSEDDVDRCKTLPGSIVRNALLEGVCI